MSHLVLIQNQSEQRTLSAWFDLIDHWIGCHGAASGSLFLAALCRYWLNTCYWKKWSDYSNVLLSSTLQASLIVLSVHIVWNYYQYESCVRYLNFPHGIHKVSIYLSIYLSIKENNNYNFLLCTAKRGFDDFKGVAKICREKELQKRAQDYRWGHRGQGLQVRS